MLPSFETHLIYGRKTPLPLWGGDTKSSGVRPTTKAQPRGQLGLFQEETGKKVKLELELVYCLACVWLAVI